MMTPYPWVTDDELYMLMGTNEERQNKSHFVFVFTEMVGETIQERKLKKNVSYDKLTNIVGSNPAQARCTRFNIM
jgi:hypothetical protein